MDNGFQFFDLLIPAMIAAFILLRLRRVLGRRTGQDRPPPEPMKREADDAPDIVVPLPERAGRRKDDSDDTDNTENEAPGEADAGSDETYYTLRIGRYADESAAAAGQPLEVGFRVLGETGADEYRVQTTHPGVFYRVPRSRIDGLPRDVFAFRFKELSNFATVDVQSFELTFNLQDAASSVEPVSVRVDRIATGWQAVGAAWRAGTAAGLIAEFARLAAVPVAAGTPADVPLAALGLLPPQTVLRAYDASGELLAEVGLGVLDPDAGIAASAHGQAASYRLDPALAEQIPISLEAYRARFLSPPVEASAVE